MANSGKVLNLQAKTNLSDEELVKKKRFDALKLQLSDRIRHDARLTSSARAVGSELASLANYRGGYAWCSQAYLAEKLGFNVKTVERAVKFLEDAGHFCVHVSTKRAAPGEIKLIYYPIFKIYTENDTGHFVGCQDSHTGQKRRRHPTKAAGDTGQNVPPISLETSLSTSAAVETLSAVGAPDGAAGQAGCSLGRPGLALRRRLGAAVFQSWFAKVALVDIAADRLLLSAPTRFIADYIAANFEAPILSSWQAENPAISCLRMTVAVTPDSNMPIERADEAANWLRGDGRDIVARLMPTTGASAEKIVAGWLRRCGGNPSSLRQILQEAQTQCLANDQLRDFVKRQTKALLRADQPALPLGSSPSLVPLRLRSADGRGVSSK